MSAYSKEFTINGLRLELELSELDIKGRTATLYNWFVDTYFEEISVMTINGERTILFGDVFSDLKVKLVYWPWDADPKVELSYEVVSFQPVPLE